MRQEDTRILVTVLRRARQLVADGWSQGAYARLTDGSPCPPDSARAAQFCLMGAIRRGLTEADYSIPVESKVVQLLGFAIADEAVGWNDDERRTQADVLARMDKALA